MTALPTERELLREAIERVRKTGVFDALSRFRNDGSFEGALITIVSAALSTLPSRPQGEGGQDLRMQALAEAVAVAEGEHTHWIKEATKHKRPGGYRSDYEQDDLERARIAQRIAEKIKTLPAKVCPHNIRWPWACADCDEAAISTPQQVERS